MIVDYSVAKVPQQFKTNICVIGSGVVGLTIINEFLSDNSKNIIVLESGGLSGNSELDSLDQVINSGDVHSSVEGSRARVFGGTSVLWGGQALPLSEIDFQTRPWVKHSGWPYNIKSLLSYYQRAAKVLGVDHVDFSTDIWTNNSGEKTKINSNLLDLTFSKWSTEPNLSTLYKQPITQSSHIRLLINASVTHIDLDGAGQNVEKVHIRNIAGNQSEIQADIFILCCGGIDNARILLTSNNVQKNGIGNQFGNVGKFYSDHIGFYGARLIPTSMVKFRNLFATKFSGQQKYLPKIELSQSRQKSERLLNVNGNLSVQINKDSAIYHLKNAHQLFSSQGLGKQTIISLLKAVVRPVEMFQIFNSYVINKAKYLPKDATCFLIANCESEPNSASTITLSNECDVFGMPKAQVNWLVSDQSKKTMLDYYESVRDELSRLKIAQTIIQPTLYEPGDFWKKRCYSLYHHIGSTRMNEDEEFGVVDADCKVHSVNNLYIAGSSVFPTASASNPTYTAMALAIKLTDHLKRIL